MSLFKKQIVIIGGSKASKKQLNAAYETGKEIAKNRYIVVCTTVPLKTQYQRGKRKKVFFMFYASQKKSFSHTPVSVRAKWWYSGTDFHKSISA